MVQSSKPTPEAPPVTIKTLPFWLGRLASVRVGCGGKNCENMTPMMGTVRWLAGETVLQQDYSSRSRGMDVKGKRKEGRNCACNMSEVQAASEYRSSGTAGKVFIPLLSRVSLISKIEVLRGFSS